MQPLIITAAELRVQHSGCRFTCYDGPRPPPPDHQALLRPHRHVGPAHPRRSGEISIKARVQPAVRSAVLLICSESKAITAQAQTYAPFP
jgi:hypothetical protein